MTTYIAFLRGINVGAHNRMRMEELRALFVSLGYEDVKTYIQSGNVVFTSEVSDEASIRREIHDAIEAEFGYDISVMLRTREELAAIVADQPFDPRTDDGVKRYVTFLHEEPGPERMANLLEAQSEAESFEVIGRNVYSELDKDALGDGRFTDVGVPLDMDTTRRTWDVVSAVLAMSD